MAGVDVWFFVAGTTLLTQSPNMPNMIGPLTEEQCQEIADKSTPPPNGSKAVQLTGTCQHAIDKHECPISEEDGKKYGTLTCPVWIFEKKK